MDRERVIPSFGQWTYTADRAATLSAYGRAERGWADKCGCVECRNFKLARLRVFPAVFLALLDGLGIDPGKEAEVYRIARLAPGRHHYGGWYHFVGTLDVTGDFPMVTLGDGLTAWMCRNAAFGLPSLKGLPVVQLEFFAEAVPWLLGEAEPM